MPKIELDIKPKPPEKIPEKIPERDLPKKKLEPVGVEKKHKTNTELEIKDAVPILKKFLINEALILIGGNGFGNQLIVRWVILLIIIIGLIFL